MSALPIVALVGRPNVGKSTFFNRLLGRPQAIVEDEPGTTRDRNYGLAEWNGKPFQVVDTGGIDYGAAEDIPRSILQQVEIAIQEADTIIFMVDARAGLTSADHVVADRLRKSGRPVLLAANKAESDLRRLESTEFYELGLGEPIPISGMHGLNTGDLLDAVALSLPDAQGESTQVDANPRVTFVGRPNVGKSSLLNALLQQDRALVSPIPGTTRDAIDTDVLFNGRAVTLVDTAGIRKRGHVDRGIEQYSVLRSMRSIGRADVAVLVIDATEPTAAQDAHIAGYVWDAGKGLVIVVNKWDLVVPKDEHTMDHFTAKLRAELQFTHDAPILFTSALTRQRVRKILEVALRVRDERRVRVPTARLNAIMHEALRRHQPASKSGRRLKLRYVTQVQSEPPTFVLFVNDPALVHFSYRRFLENQLRAEFGFFGSAIRLFFRDSPSAASAKERLLAQGRLAARDRNVGEPGTAAPTAEESADPHTEPASARVRLARSGSAARRMARSTPRERAGTGNHGSPTSKSGRTRRPGANGEAH